MNIKSDYIRLLIGERTLKEFAPLVGVTPVWLGQVLKQGRAGAGLINRLAEALDVEPLALIKGE